MKKVFQGDGSDFSATREAEEWLREHSYSFGSMQRGSPRATLKGDYVIGKWRNLSVEDRRDLDGVMTGDGRNGPITIEIFGDRESEVAA